MNEYKVISSKNRYKGKLPKIGIRPTIDGRQGEISMRDSLEDQTMNLAISCADFISKHVTLSKWR